MDILNLISVGLTYQSPANETEALHEINFAMKEGEFAAIVGPSGCGKTTILSLIAGLIKPTSGQILVEGKPVDRVGENVGYMLQRDNLFSWRSILDNVTLGLEVNKKKTPENIDYAINLLKKYGLGDFIKAHPAHLSGGMRQRAALIRTLAFRPNLLLLDEPFSALDFQTRLAVCDDVYAIIRAEKKTALLVTHDISDTINRYCVLRYIKKGEQIYENPFTLFFF